MTISYQKDTHSFVSKSATIYKIYIPIQHWQLRDMIKTHKNGFIYSDNHSLNSYNTKTKMSNQVITNIGFQPTCISHLDEIYAVGGSKGQVCIKSLQTYKGQTGHTINNGVHLFNKNGYKMLVSNNDATIRIFDVETLTLIQTLDHGYAINNAEVSPDGKMMVCCSDSSSVYGYYYESGIFKKYETFKTMNDAGFKTSWNSLSNLFAVSTQDCYACVFDIRQTEKLIAIKSRQFNSPKGAVRVVEFSKKRNLDLLLFSEHISYISLVDTRNFELRQSVLVTEKDGEKNISGAIFSDKGDSVIVSVDDAVYEYKLTTDIRRVFAESDQM